MIKNRIKLQNRHNLIFFSGQKHANELIPWLDYSAFARAKAFQDLTEEESNWFEDLEEDIEYDSRIQRPESMIIPIGGVWRPDDEPPEQFFLDQPANSANSTNNSTKCNFDTVQQIQQQIHQQSSTISTTETTAIDSSNSRCTECPPYIKSSFFWEGHKNLRNLPYGFDVY